MVPLISDFVVEKRRWLTDEEMVDCIAVAQSLPGAVVINVATYVGKRVAGILGTIAATLGVVVPSFICIIFVLLVLGQVGDNKYVDGAFEGAKAAAAALIVLTCINMGRKIIKSPFDWVLMILPFIAIVVFKVSAFTAILFGIIMGLSRYLYLKIKREGE